MRYDEDDYDPDYGNPGEGSIYDCDPDHPPEGREYGEKEEE